MYDNSNEIIVSNSKKSKEINDIEKAIDKLKLQEKRLVDLYLSSSLNVEVINQKNENIKKEITKLTNKRESMFPEDDNKEYTVELLKKLNCKQENNEILFPKNFAFTNLWDSLNKRAKKGMIKNENRI